MNADGTVNYQGQTMYYQFLHKELVAWQQAVDNLLTPDQQKAVIESYLAAHKAKDLSISQDKLLAILRLGHSGFQSLPQAQVKQPLIGRLILLIQNAGWSYSVVAQLGYPMIDGASFDGITEKNKDGYIADMITKLAAATNNAMRSSLAQWRN